MGPPVSSQAETRWNPNGRKPSPGVESVTLRFLRSQLLVVHVFVVIMTTRRVSEGRTRQDVSSDITSSLAYASGWVYIKKRNFRRLDLG